MRFKESARFAWTGVVANKMRSLLTMLGIIIGVASVITLVAVGTGSNAAVQASINRLGSNSLFVLPTATVAGGQGSAFLAQARRMLGLKEDAAAVVDNPEAPHVTGVTPAVVVRSVPTVLGSSSHTTAIIIGATPAYLTINNDTIAAGSLFTDADYLAHRRVAVVGTSVAADLVDGDSSELVGKTIQVNGQPFLVTGILGSKGYSGQQDLDDKIFANESAVADSLYGYYPPGQSPLSALDVQVEPGHSADAQIEVTKLLLKRHQVDMANTDFVVFNPSAVLAAGSSANKTLTILLAAVAGISLLVGGIGVMNIMLVSVTERTREIGIRKAIGGNRRDIITQFLGEAVILSMIGGTIGVVIGVTVAHFPIAGVQPQIAPYSIYLAFGVSLFTGLFFGFYPASRAASLRPIEALRYE
jgi:putative ABC transport system permease protein